MTALTGELSRIAGEAFAGEGLDAALGLVTLSDRPDLCQFQCNGALAAAKLARHQTAAALLVALVVLSGVVGMIMKVPHPTWLSVAGLLLPIPVSLLAVRLVYRRATLPRVP
jgi:hypothetical protein